MKKRTLTAHEIETITAKSRAYVETQLATMRRYGSAPSLGVEGFEQLVAKCAKPMLELARWTPAGEGRR